MSNVLFLNLNDPLLSGVNVEDSVAEPVLGGGGGGNARDLVLP